MDTVEKFLADLGELEESFRIQGVWKQDLWKVWCGDLVFLNKAVCFVRHTSGVRIPMGVTTFITLLVGLILYDLAGLIGSVVGGAISFAVLEPLRKATNGTRISRLTQESEREAREQSFQDERNKGQVVFAVKEPKFEFKSGTLSLMASEEAAEDAFSVCLSQDVYEKYASRIEEYEAMRKAQPGWGLFS